MINWWMHAINSRSDNVLNSCITVRVVFIGDISFKRLPVIILWNQDIICDLLR